MRAGHDTEGDLFEVHAHGLAVAVRHYDAGGLAFSHTTVSATEGDLSDDANLTGWTIGAGIEQAFTDRISVKFEYLYSEFGDHTWFEGEDYSSTSSSSSSTVRAGINLHF